MGAVILSCRIAAMNVSVFQLPSGTRPINLAPRGARPLSRAMLVVIAVSSRNTSRAGLSRPCSRIQRRRARTTSARSRSAACRLFFKGDLVPLEKTRQRATAGANPMPSKLCNGFYQGQVRLFGNHRQHPFRQLFQRRNAASPRLRGGTPAFMPALHPLHGRTHTDPEMLGGLTPRRPFFNCLDNAST